MVYLECDVINASYDLCMGQANHKGVRPVFRFDWVLKRSCAGLEVRSGIGERTCPKDRHDQSKEEQYQPHVVRLLDGKRSVVR